MTSVEVSGQEEVQMTSPVRPEELSAAIDSILLDTEQSVPETSDGQAQVCAPSPALVSHPPASPPVADNAPDLWLRLLRPLRLRSTRPLTLWPFPFLQRVPADPRYFFFGAPSIDDPSPNARLINEAKERHERMGLKCIFRKFSAYEPVCDPEGGKLMLT